LGAVAADFSDTGGTAGSPLVTVAAADADPPVVPNSRRVKATAVQANGDSAGVEPSAPAPSHDRRFELTPDTDPAAGALVITGADAAAACGAEDEDEDEAATITGETTGTAAAAAGAAAAGAGATGATEGTTTTAGAVGTAGAVATAGAGAAAAGAGELPPEPLGTDFTTGV